MSSSWFLYQFFKKSSIFSAKTSEKWKDIRFYSPVYTVEIPKNAAIFLTLKRVIDQNTPIVLGHQSYQSVVATPNYGISKLNRYVGNSFIFVKYEISNYPVKFTALNYNIEAPDVLAFIVNNTLQ